MNKEFKGEFESLVISVCENGIIHIDKKDRNFENCDYKIFLVKANVFNDETGAIVIEAEKEIYEKNTYKDCFYREEDFQKFLKIQEEYSPEFLEETEVEVLIRKFSLFPFRFQKWEKRKLIQFKRSYFEYYPSADYYTSAIFKKLKTKKIRLLIKDCLIWTQMI